jgi:hypothetical protein
VHLEELTERMSAPEPTPASGTAATVVLELALALVAKVVARSGNDGPMGGLTSQVRAVHRRLEGEGDRVEATYTAALDALAAGDRIAIGQGVGEALDAVLRLAGTAADVAELARAVADRCDPVARPDAAGGGRGPSGRLEPARGGRRTGREGPCAGRCRRRLGCRRSCHLTCDGRTLQHAYSSCLGFPDRRRLPGRRPGGLAAVG